MFLLRRLPRAGVCLRDRQGNAVVVIVEVQARLKDGKHEKDATEVYWSLIESFAFPFPAYSSAMASSSTGAEACLLTFLQLPSPGSPILAPTTCRPR